MKYRRFISLIISCLSCFLVWAQTKKEKDQEAIKTMCGCYEVSFNFAETFQYSEDPDYKASKKKRVEGLEWVQLVADTDDKIVLQHLLIVGKPETPKVIKHWRQDWVFENTDLYVYDSDNTWKFVKLPKESVKGKWTQKVFQVDDGPRYEGAATWIHIDGKSYWENTTMAPLPRREYTKRSDYNIVLRGNRHEIIKEGWIHDQDNKKIIRTAGKDKILAEEKGYNTYVKVDDDRCEAAQNWWQKNAPFWNKVRQSWDDVFAKKQDLTLISKVGNKSLGRHLSTMKSDAEGKAIADVMNAFIKAK